MTPEDATAQLCWVSTLARRGRAMPSRWRRPAAPPDPSGRRPPGLRRSFFFSPAINLDHQQPTRPPLLATAVRIAGDGKKALCHLASWSVLVPTPIKISRVFT